MVVVKIGGCNGSGKTSVVRALLGGQPMSSLYNQTGKKIEAYKSGPVEELQNHSLVILGSYKNVCGGMDTISDKHERLSLLEYYTNVKSNVVVYEGLITGKTYGAMGAMSEQPGHMGRWLYMFMDTPFDVCVERVLARRKVAATAKYGEVPCIDTFDPERTMRPTFKGCQGAARIAAEKGHKVIMLDHTKTPDQLARDIIKHVKKIL